MAKVKSTGPSNNLQKLARQLFESEGEQKKFLTEVTEGKSSAPAIIWTKPRPESIPFDILGQVENVEFADYVESDQKLGKLELHNQGFFYSLDLSSVLCASAMLGVENSPTTILDLCAAPGGKAIFAAMAFSPEELICNEVIGKRTAQLISNLKRCEIKNARVTSRDPSYFVKENLKFDLVIVDAPCSGQSLIARGEESPGCFHPATINMNSNRQKRIIANAAQLLNPGGYLAYITCTYSLAENEKVIDWTLKKFQFLSSVEVKHLEGNKSKYSKSNCYRFLPGQNCGAGGFAALLRKI